MLRFCYFMGNILSLKSYYQLSHVFVWLTGTLLTVANIFIKSWNVHFRLALNWGNAGWPIWWLKQLTKPCKLNELDVVNSVYLLTCAWVFCFLKVQKFNLSPTLVRSKVGLVSCLFYNLILRMASSWNLHRSYFMKNMLFCDVILFDLCIFHNSGIISADITRN